MWEVLRIDNICKHFGAIARTEHTLEIVLKNVNLTLQSGGFYCILGPSGCGKTTLLNIIAGFEPQTSGTIYIEDPYYRVIEGPGTDRVVIFQDVANALFPWLRAIENVEFGLKMKKMRKKECRQKALQYLELVGLSEHVQKFPYELSGGMKQRVQLARALVIEPEILLMDEPFAALDAITKKILQEELVRIWQETRKTIIYITHDIMEAIILGTEIFVMSAGPESTIKKGFEVNIRKPISPSNPDFLEIFGEVGRILEGEVQRMRARGRT